MIRRNRYFIVMAAMFLAYPFAVEILRIQSPLMTIRQGMPLNMVIVAGILGYYTDEYAKKNGLAKWSWAIGLGVFIVFALLMRLMGFGTIIDKIGG